MISIENDCRLSGLAAHRSRETGKKVDRSQVLDELITPLLSGVVVTIRGKAGQDEAVGPDLRVKNAG